MNAKATMPEWPKVKVVHYPDTKRPNLIMTLEDAAEKYGLDERTVNWFRSGGLAGTGVKGFPHVDTIEIFTLRDSIADAGPDLLQAIKGVYKSHLRSGCYTKEIGAPEEADCSCLVWKSARAAITKAETGSPL